MVSQAYPSGYFPRDDLAVKDDPLDWNGDHLHTNFKTIFTFLKDAGYYVEVLDAPFSCFDASDYGVLLVVDPEEEFFAEELIKLRDDVDKKGLGLVVVGDWYGHEMIKHVAFEDDNTRNFWFPETGGANIPALNELLGMWKMEFGASVYSGIFRFLGDTIKYSSGTSIARFPAGGTVFAASLEDLEAKIQGARRATASPTVLGFYPGVDPGNSGRIAV